MARCVTALTATTVANNLSHVCDDDEKDDNVIMSSEGNNEIKLRDVTLLVNRANDVYICNKVFVTHYELLT